MRRSTRPAAGCPLDPFWVHFWVHVWLVPSLHAHWVRESGAGSARFASVMHFWKAYTAVEVRVGRVGGAGFQCMKPSGVCTSKHEPGCQVAPMSDQHRCSIVPPLAAVCAASLHCLHIHPMHPVACTPVPVAVLRCTYT